VCLPHPNSFPPRFPPLGAKGGLSHALTHAVRIVGPVGMPQESAVGRKRDRDSETASGTGDTGDQESGLLSELGGIGDSPAGTPTGTPGLAPQKKPRLTFGGGLRAISASQALEKKKLDPSSPATPGGISSIASSPHPGGADGGGVLPKPGEGEMSPLGGPAAAPEPGVSRDASGLSLGAAAIDGQAPKLDKPRLVFPAAASSGGAEEKPKPKLTFGGGLSGAPVPIRSPSATASASGASETSESTPRPRLTFGGGLAADAGGSGSGLRWPAAASSSASVSGAGPSHAASPRSSGAQGQQWAGGPVSVSASRDPPSPPAPHRPASHLPTCAPFLRTLASSPFSACCSAASHLSYVFSFSYFCSPRRGQGAGGRAGGGASSGAAHLEALSDSDGEGERRMGRSVSPGGGGGGAVAVGGGSRGADKREDLRGHAQAASSAAASSAAATDPACAPRHVDSADGSQRAPGAAGGPGGDATAVGGEGEGGKEEEGGDAGAPVASSEELLAKIQVVDDAIAATDAEIAALQAHALQGEGAIFGMSAKRKAAVLIFGPSSPPSALSMPCRGAGCPPRARPPIAPRVFLAHVDGLASWCWAWVLPWRPPGGVAIV
jgi:hypothetical protein